VQNELRLASQRLASQREVEEAERMARAEAVRRKKQKDGCSIM